MTPTYTSYRTVDRLEVETHANRSALGRAAARAAALSGPITPARPASILRLHPRATLYLDPAAASAQS